MKSKKLNFKNIDEYINLFPEDVQDKLRKLRSTIRKAAPNAEEKISYQMPVFALNGNLEPVSKLVVLLNRNYLLVKWTNIIQRYRMDFGNK
ncbi:iron chaperone [Leptospira kirschneri]|uniref:iron chaperone n=2 Tax=Leptospira kirschneri TaxID=29507 RepID=UPI00398B1319